MKNPPFGRGGTLSIISHIVILNTSLSLHMTRFSSETSPVPLRWHLNNEES